MPLYNYVCDVCGARADEFLPISQYRPEIPCPKCGDTIMMRRDFAEATPHLPDMPYQRPIEMYSLAPNNPAEVAAFQRRNPDVKLNDQLVPIAHSRQEKLRILKNEGYEEKN